MRGRAVLLLQIIPASDCAATVITGMVKMENSVLTATSLDASFVFLLRTITANITVLPAAGAPARMQQVTKIIGSRCRGYIASIKRRGARTSRIPMTL